MRRTIRMVALSMLGAALMLSAVAMTPGRLWSEEVTVDHALHRSR